MTAKNLRSEAKTVSRRFSLGIIGHPIGHSLSPVMHRAAADHLDLSLTYEPIDIPPGDLGRFMADLREAPIDGLNVTVPHKVAVMEYLDESSPEAGRIGAVNTIYRVDDELHGHNTDGYGFLASLQRNAKTSAAGKKIFVYGAGGAARAICDGLVFAGCAEMTIANRTARKAGALVSRLETGGCGLKAIGYDSNNLVESVRSADIIVNTTSVGMEGVAETELPASEHIHEGQLVVDIVYRPLETGLLRRAKDAGARTLDGLWMLVHQGAKSFELWTGQTFPVELARAALLRELNED